MSDSQNPHQGQPVVTAGLPLEDAAAAMILTHGRGASPQDILGLAASFEQTNFAYLAPQAANYTWYPTSFLSPIADNEPGISSGIRVLADLVNQVEQAGIPAERIFLLGFSQGACLSLEFAARNARRYGAVIGLSGGLIGPDDTPREYPGSMDDTPVFLGCSDVDPHIPKERVHHTAEIFTRLGAKVTEKLYPNMPHAVFQDEIDRIKEIIQPFS